MKKQIIISMILLLAAAMLYSFRYVNLYGPAPSGIDTADKYLLGAMHDGIDAGYLHNTEPGFNVWHHYTGPTGFGWPGVSNDNINTATSQYADAIRNRLVNNESHNMFTLMDRPKIEYLAFGQRSDYQCEPIAVGEPFWFYAYDSSFVGTPVPDSNQTVMHCTTNQGQGWIAKNLRANREQANYFWPDWINDDTYPWYILPRIRINPQDTIINKKVCKIEALRWDGQIIDSIVINSKNFTSNGFVYSGQYLETYFSRSGLPINQEFGPGQILNPTKIFFARWDIVCLIDFRVWYYDECEMWIDRIRVENDPAHKLLTLKSAHEDSMIVSEVNEIALPELNSGNLSPFKFYIEEFEFNTVPCLSYINKRIDVLSDHRMSLMINLNYELFQSHMPDYSNYWLTAEQVKSYLIDSVQSKELFMGAYCLEGWNHADSTSRESYSPNTLPVYSNYSGDYERNLGILSYKVSPNEYDDWLQESFDNYNTGWKGTKYTYLMRMANSISRISGIPFYNLMQAHLWWAAGHKLKEPSNEELKMMANLAVAYGTKGIMYFAYGSESDTFSVADTMHYSRGLVNPDLTPRTLNVYGQNKWEAINQIDSTLKNWSPYLMSFDKINIKSFIYRIPAERTDMSNNTFIRDMSTFPADPLYYPDPDPDEMDLETNNDTYLQASFFQRENETEQNKYFMIINRRCSPFLNYNTADNIGGKRFVFMRVNSTNLQDFNNWKIIDLETGDSVLTFNKKDTVKYLYLGEYEPGEGRLYRVAPVMQEGGTLVADEECGGDIECKGEVNNNGKNIFLKPGTNISFADHTARIKMTGGVFKSGHSQTQNSPVYLKGKDNCSWKGISLYGCDSVLIKDTHFSNISPYPVDSTYAVDMINCKFINIESGSFVSEGSLNAGCIRSGYVINGDFDYSAYIQGNTFETDEGEIPALSFIATAGLTLPLIIDGNTFSSASSEGSSNAILLSNISGGVIKNNTITEYINSIIMLSSSMDLYNITSGIDNSAGIQLYSFSTAFLKPSGMYYTGGYNDFTNLGDGSRNIELLTSYFNIYKGYNDFNVESNSDYHLIGSVYLSDLTNPTQNAKLNCFQFDGTNTAENQALVWDNTGMPAEYIFTPYSCEIEAPIAYEVFNIANRINDTIYYEQTGTGGGKSNYELRITNYELRAKAGKDESRINNKEENTEITSLESLSDSIGINIRRRNYEKVSEDCMNILTNYPDSLESIGIISKLYLAKLRLDSVGSKMTGLKTFLESLILNHPNNTALVKQAFYYIQKCKVSLKQYESAMTGFLEIMDENPYSYEGLVASWDFSATSLLFEGGGGAGGGISNYKLQISNDESRDDEIEISDDDKSQIRNSKSQIFSDDPNDKYDKKTFTGEDRKIIRENVFNIFETSKENETEKVRSLERKNEEGKASKEEKAELEKKKTLSETIKARKPADAFEHIKFVNNDIQKVFGVSGRGSEKESNNIIPNEYSLSQNYPNPFNPITHLEFGISDLGFVSLKVYDVLGREIKTLVNEIRPAGIYKIEFDGSNFASGVYFYRIEAGDFAQTKRMVLIK